MTPKHLIPRLLSGRDRISRPEQEALLARVLDDVRPRARLVSLRGWRRLLWVGAATTGVIGLALGAWLAAGGRGSDAAAPRFAARGGAPGPSLRPLCVDATGRVPCRQGGKLAFELATTPELRYLSAFSRRADGTVIWYFPAAGGRARDLAGAGGLEDGLLHTGVALGAEHPAGRYQVYGIFSAAPLTREEVRALIDPARPGGVRPRAVIRTATVEVR